MMPMQVMMKDSHYLAPIGYSSYLHSSYLHYLHCLIIQSLVLISSTDMAIKIVSCMACVLCA